MSTTKDPRQTGNLKVRWIYCVRNFHLDRFLVHRKKGAIVQSVKKNKQADKHTLIQTSKYHKNLCALWSKGEGWIQFKEQGKLATTGHAMKKRRQNRWAD